MSKTTTAAEIIAAAHETADEIARVYAAHTRIMHDGATIAANALRDASGTKNIDRLFELASAATAAASAADDANDAAWTSAQVASEYVRKARRTAAAYKAAATRAGFTAEAVERRDAAAEALQIVEDAYEAAEATRRAGNREFNAAVRDAREVVRFAKLEAAAQRVNDIRTNYPATTEDDAREAIRRELDTRSKDIDAASESFRIPFDKNERIAAKVAAYAFATEAEQAKQDERADRSAKLATTRTRHMNIGEKRQQAHTIDGANGWSARIEYAPQHGNHITYDWRVEVYRNDIYVCHDIFWTIEEAEAYAEAMTREPEPDEKTHAICVTAPAALLAAYADAIGESIAKDDPEARAAYLVAIDERFGTSEATGADRKIVDDMIEAIAADAHKQAATPAAKTYTIICTTKANRTEYLHAVTVEADSIKSAKQTAYDHIYTATSRHAFKLSNVTANPAQRLINWCADRWNISAAEVIEAAKSPQGVDIYGNAPEPEPETTEAIHKAYDAAVSFCAAYTEATGEIPYADDAAAVCRVARHDIAHQLGSTRADRETVDAMVQAIAERTHAAEAIEDAREAWTGPDYYRIGYSDGGMDATNDGAIWYETAADLARDLRSAYESATNTHLPYAETAPAPIYQRHELESYLGEPEDYDLAAIEAEATAYDPKTGAQVWRADIDLAAICERHELYSYAIA